MNPFFGGSRPSKKRLSPGWVSFLRDKKREKNTTYAEEILRGSNLLFLVVGEDGTILYISATTDPGLRTLPIDVGHNIRLLQSEFHPTQGQETFAHLLVETGSHPEAFQCKLLRMTGDWYHLRVYPKLPHHSYRIWQLEDITEETHSQLAHVAALTEASEQLQERDEVARYKQYYESIVLQSPIAIGVVNGQGKLVTANTAFTVLFQLDTGSKPLSDWSVSDFLSAEDGQKITQAFSWVREGKPPFWPLEIGFKTSEEKVAATYAHRLSPDLDWIVVYFMETTEQKRLQIQFVQSQKMQAVGQLAGGIAHDFNNLLTAMIGFCDLLLTRHIPGDQSFGDIMQIKQNANRAANLVRQLLAFSRKQNLQPRVLDITEELSELSALLRRLLGENVELRITHGRDLWYVRCDQVELDQVMINLAVNARDAMDHQGVLTIQTKNHLKEQPTRLGNEWIPAGEYVVIEVADTGCGMTREVMDHIFEPFFSTKEVGSGTGLGLSTVYGIIKQTGGFIFVESQVGKGSTFTILLPRHQPRAGEESGENVRDNVVSQDQKPAMMVDLTGHATLLLVEDEEAVRMFAARALKNKGYHVMEASSGEEALILLSKTSSPIDLLITDVVMPKMDGPTLVKEIHALYPNLKVIFMSGYTEDAFRHRLGVESRMHFLAKPFTLKELAQKVKDVLGEAP